MKDYLLDLVEHTYDLGCIDAIKIVGDDKSTRISGLPTEPSVVVQAEFKAPVPEFIGTCGMPNLSKLKILLNLPEYRENAKITLQRKADGTLENLEFCNAVGDFRNTYRFMSPEVANEKIKNMKFRGVKWNVEFEPTVAAIQRLRMQAQANADEPNFQVRIDGTDLKFHFGDHSRHAGEFVFQAGVKGTLKRTWSWPVAVVQNILALTGDKIMRISDDGAAEITVDSGLVMYTYILPALSK
jgi:hypothetical protein